jgi:hypothetical protein
MSVRLALRFDAALPFSGLSYGIWQTILPTRSLTIRIIGFLPQDDVIRMIPSFDFDAA